jgi:hypothetical protein
MRIEGKYLFDFVEETRITQKRKMRKKLRMEMHTLYMSKSRIKRAYPIAVTLNRTFTILIRDPQFIALIFYIPEEALSLQDLLHLRSDGQTARAGSIVAHSSGRTPCGSSNADN